MINSTITAVAAIAASDVGNICQPNDLCRHHAITTRAAAAAAAGAGHIARLWSIAGVVASVAALAAVFTNQVVLIGKILCYGFSMISTVASASASASNAIIRRPPTILSGSPTIFNLRTTIIGSIAAFSADSATCSSPSASSTSEIDKIAMGCRPTILLEAAAGTWRRCWRCMSRDTSIAAGGLAQSRKTHNAHDRQK
ncbi:MULTISPECIES: hypothetical protein [unclassified Ochrobactrum]|uniref:hypothetical protein n=1 Tax=unclassified Ochrobactrum TaxID=239106 RepID=UPI0013B3823E|nr:MULTISPECIES: hypothetical protein [unclassified Ochrobactrum]MBQ0710303.1 hypothetical protein [Ochrobactrum sp. AP1BH01-1]